MNDEKNGQEKNQKISVPDNGSTPPPLPKSSLLLRTIAGAYLLYLVYSLLGGLASAEGSQRLLLLAAALVFAAVGLWLLVTTLRRFVRGEYRGGARDPERGKGDETER